MRFRNALLFFGLTLAWGSAFTAIKAGLEFFPPVLFAALRYDLAAVLIFVYAALVTDRWRPRGRAEWTVVAIGGVFLIALYHAFLFVGEQGTTSAAAAIVVSLSPILTTGFARVFLPAERLTAVGAFGLVIGFLGVGILSAPSPENLTGGRTISLLFVFCATVAFALGSVLTGRIDDDLPIETMEAWSMIIGALVLHGISFAIGEPIVGVRLASGGLLAISYLAVVYSVVGFLIYFDLLERLGPIEINLVSYATPVVAAVTGVLVLGETPTAGTAVGFTLILGGFCLLKRETLGAELARLRASRCRDTDS
jgi:drug/metabolite transporter (DMT)-like permease